MTARTTPARPAAPAGPTAASPRRRRQPHPQLFPHRPRRRRSARDHDVADLVLRHLGRRLGEARSFRCAYLPETYLPGKIPGIGLIVALVALTLLGFLTANLVGRTLVEAGERMLDRMPLVRSIYKGLKQVFETLFSQSGSSFRKVGLVEFPAPGMWSLVFLSQPPSERDHRGAAEQGGARVGVHAVHAEPDHRLLLLRAAQRRDRARHPRRGGGQAHHVGRPDPADRGDGPKRARGARRQPPRAAQAARAAEPAAAAPVE